MLLFLTYYWLRLDIQTTVQSAVVVVVVVVVVSIVVTVAVSCAPTMVVGEIGLVRRELFLRFRDGGKTREGSATLAKVLLEDGRDGSTGDTR